MDLSCTSISFHFCVAASGVSGFWQKEFFGILMLSGDTRVAFFLGSDFRLLESLALVSPSRDGWMVTQAFVLPRITR